MFLALLVLSTITSCAYHGNIEESLYTATLHTPQKIPLKVHISTNNQHISDIKTAGGLGETYEISIESGLYKSTYALLSDLFETTYKANSEESPNADYEVEILFSITPVIIDNWTGHHLYESTLGLVFYDKQAGVETARFMDKQSVDIYPTATGTALSAVTGASLFLLAPVTIPAAVQAEGKHGKEVLERSLKKSFNALATDIKRNKERLLYSKVKGGNQPNAQRQPDAKKVSIPSLYDSILKSVVVINAGNSIGSGFFITNDGYIITNSHVVGNAGKVSVVLKDKSVLIGSVLARDTSRDLALIKVAGTIIRG